MSIHISRLLLCLFLQYCADCEPFLCACRSVIKALIQGVLPGIVLKLFLIFLPAILMFMSKIEGFTAISFLERRAAWKYYIFQLVNVFLGSIIAGAAFEQLNTFIHQPANKYVLLISVLCQMPLHLLFNSSQLENMFFPFSFF